jgi:hypothetical protein
MEKSNKILIILFTAIISAGIVIFVYEVLLKKNTTAPTAAITDTDGMVKITEGRKTSYTASEVIDMIKKDKVYLGDSIVIYDNGDLTSSNPKFQGTINAILQVESNIKGLAEQVKATKIPFQYHLYIFAATVYRDQYADEFTKSPKDSTAK